MWIFAIVVVLLLILLKTPIKNALTNHWANTLMKDPSFIKEVEKANAAHDEYITKRAKLLVEAATVISADEVWQHAQKAVDDCQDVKKGLALHLLRVGIVENYGVDLETAIECVRIGLLNGKMVIDPAVTDEKLPDIQKLFTVTPK
jgi:hypothetical protein